jgi:hypothetical protein
LTQRPNDSATIEIDRPDVQEVLRVLDAVVEPLGFKASSEPTTNDSIRVYWLNRQPATVDGRSYSRNVPIRVIHTPKGIEVAFGHFGFLGGTPEPARQPVWQQERQNKDLRGRCTDRCRPQPLSVAVAPRFALVQRSEAVPRFRFIKVPARPAMASAKEWIS